MSRGLHACKEVERLLTAMPREARGESFTKVGRIISLKPLWSAGWLAGWQAGCVRDPRCCHYSNGRLNELLDFEFNLTLFSRRPMFGTTFFLLDLFVPRALSPRHISFPSPSPSRFVELKQHPVSSSLTTAFAALPRHTINYTYSFPPFISTFVLFFNLIPVSLCYLHTFAYSALYREV